MDTKTSFPHNGGMTTTVQIKLKRLRDELGWSVEDMSRALKLKAKSSYAHYESKKYKKQFIPIDLANKIANIIEAEGLPRWKALELAGVQGESLPSENIRQSGGRMAAIDELDLSVSGGAGTTVDEIKAIRTWLLPNDVVSISTDSGVKNVRILRVKGDSMSPTYNPLDRILVDIGDTVPSPGGVFVVYDGLGLVVKRVEYIPHSDPPTVRITSDNPRFEPYERTLDEAYIQGRVIGKWLWA